MNRNHLRRLSGAALLLASLAAATACTAPAQTQPVAPAPAQPPAAAAAPAAQPAVAPAAQPAVASTLKFPNTDLAVLFTKYDPKTKMVEFHKVAQVPGSDPISLGPDPSDPVTHRLPMSATATVQSIDPHGFPFETCPPTSCTPDNVMDAVIGHDAPEGLFANIHVNAADRIETVAEMSY